MTAEPPEALLPADESTRDKKARKDKKKEKKKDKLRSAWISFVGRIVAQVVGAAATIVLGLLIAHRLRPSLDRAPLPAATTAAITVGPRAPGDTVSLAVLPLANLSGDTKQEYFADGMTEALITDLAQLRGVRVISRTSSMHYKGERRSLPDIATELGVDFIVEGSVARAADRVRVTAQLIDARHDQHLWAHTYDHTVRDIFALQGEVATAIAREVKTALGPGLERRLTQRSPVDPDVYDLYLRGRHAWNLRTVEGYREAIRFFDQALQKDAAFALAHAGLADTYSLLGAGATSGGATAVKAKAAATRAIELDDGLAEAHTSLAAVLHREEGRRADAEREFRRAIALNPGYATGHQWFAVLLAEDGRDREAADHAQQAVTLDPLSGPMHLTLGLVHYYGRRYPPSAAEERRALELTPQLALARVVLTRALLAQGDTAGAIQAAEQTPPPLTAETLVLLGLAHARAGRRDRADALFKELAAREPAPTAALARWYAATGDQASALDMLERTLAAGPGSFQPLIADPAFDGLRANARFADLLRRAKRT